MARIVEVILVEENRGKGTTDDVFRMVVQLWTKDRRLLAESDNYPSGGRGTDAASFVDREVIRSIA